MAFHEDLVPVQVVVTLWLKEDSDIQEVVSEMDYEFRHEAIKDTEISDIITEV